MIPLYQTNKHELISLTGKISTFHKVIPSDIEGVTDFEQEAIFKSFEKDIINATDDLKIYWLNEKLYIHSENITSVKRSQSHVMIHYQHSLEHTHKKSTFMRTS